MTTRLIHNNENFEFLAQRKSSFLVDLLVKQGELNHYETFGMSHPFRGLVVSTKGIADIYAEKNSLEYLNEEFFEEIFSRGNLESATETVSLIWQNLNKIQNNACIKDFLNQYRKLTPSLAITTGLASKVQDRVLTKMALDGFKESDLAVLLHTESLSDTLEERLSLLNVCTLIDKDKYSFDDEFIQEMLDKHTQKFQHIPVNYDGKPWTLDYFIMSAQKLLQQGDVLNQRNALIRGIDENTSLRLKLLSGVDSTVYDTAISFQEFNERRKSVISKSNLFLQNRLYELATNRNIDPNLLIYLTPEELSDFEKNDSLPENEIELRREFFINISGNTLVQTLYDDKSLVHISDHQGSAIKGVCASPGDVYGQVKFLSNVDLNTFEAQPTDILVASMTSVDSVNKLRSALGIITDEGGITCHAAIVARELRKPCLVGTGNSTRTLKDGDYVRLNASKGIVDIVSELEYLKHQNCQVISGTRNPSTPYIVKPKHFPAIISSLSDSNDSSDYGSKVNNLRRFYQDVTVSPGFVLTPRFMEEYFVSLNRRKEFADNDFILLRQILSQESLPQNLLDKVLHNYANLDTEEVVVRSSNALEDLPGLSFAGQYDSYLHVKGDNALDLAIRNCWASCFNPRVIEYLKDNGIVIQQPEMSVLIQKQIDASESGVLFTANPISGNLDEYVLDVVKDECNSIVSGKVTPTNYSSSKKEIIPKYEDVIRQGIYLEKSFGAPLDIEWCRDAKEKLYILQLRPITTIN